MAEPEPERQAASPPSPEVEQLEKIAARLDELTAQLRDSSLATERAVELAREAGELAARAATEIDRQARAAAQPLSGADQDELF